MKGPWLKLTDAQYLVAIEAAYQAIEALAKQSGVSEDSLELALQLFSTGFNAAREALDGI